MALHGCAQRAADFARFTRFDEIAQKIGAYVLYPEQAERANANRCWNWFLPEHQSRENGEPRAILSLIDAVRAHHAIDARRVFLTGFSAGGAMAAILAEQAPEIFAAVGIAAGVPPYAVYGISSAFAAPPLDDGRQRVMIWQGDDDTLVVPMNSAMLARQFARRFGLERVTPEIEQRGHARVTRRRDASGRVRVEEWRIARLAHDWSTEPDASAEMMRFFLAESVL